MWLKFIYFLYLGISAAQSSCPNACLCNLENVDCSNQYLSRLPPGIDTNVISLDLSINNFEVLPQELSTFERLAALNVSRNELSSLATNDLKVLRRLRNIDLSNNLFSDWVDIKIIMRLTEGNVSYLNFSNNPLGQLPEGVFRLNSLLYLGLRNCSLTSINVVSFNSLSNIEKLDMSQNVIHHINSSKYISTSLKILDLSECKIKHIQPKAFSGFTSLHTLYLRKNSYFRKASLWNTNLKELYLTESGIETIPNGNLPSLITLDLFGNNIREITKESFIGLGEIQLLNISNNIIRTIENGSFTYLRKLSYIDLSVNVLATIDRFIFLNNSQLVQVNLSHNYVQEFPKFRSSSIEYLDVSFCEITNMSKWDLSEMKSLEYLDLTYNRISNLPEYTVSFSLIHLDLSFNRIQNINNKTFVNLRSLRILTLSGNRLTTISPNYFPQVLSLQINDNPWRCDCKALSAMYIWLSHQGYNFDSLICQSPDKFEGKTWMEACQNSWGQASSRFPMWLYILSATLVGLTITIIICTNRRIQKFKKERLDREATRREEDRRREELESLERMREAEIEFVEPVTENAPDPRALQRPPSYTEAMLLPRLDGSYSNLTGSLHSLASKRSAHASNPELTKKKRRKRRKRPSESNLTKAASRGTVTGESTEEDEEDRRE